jgi:hypothetical protein
MATSHQDIDPQDPLDIIGPDAAAAFDDSPSNPTEHASSENLGTAFALDDEEEDEEEEDEDLYDEDSEEDDDEDEEDGDEEDEEDDEDAEDEEDEDDEDEDDEDELRVA